MVISTKISTTKQCSHKAQCHVTTQLVVKQGACIVKPLPPCNFLPTTKVSREAGRKLKIPGNSQTSQRRRGEAAAKCVRVSKWPGWMCKWPRDGMSSAGPGGRCVIGQEVQHKGEVQRNSVRLCGCPMWLGEAYPSNLRPSLLASLLAQLAGR